MEGAGFPLNPLRDDLEAVVNGSLGAVAPAALVRETLERGILDGHSEVLLLAVGKAAPGMASGAAAFLGQRVRSGLILAPANGEPAPPGDLRVFRGGHPLPDEEGVRGAAAVLEAVEDAGRDDPILFLLSGGGSSLLTLPSEGVSLDAVRRVTRLLLEAGADIRELNTVRKHLDRLKGGGIARAASPAPVSALVISDVVGDPLDVIASGPLSPDPTTYQDALDVLDRYGLREEDEGAESPTLAPPEVVAHLEAGARGERPETAAPGDPAFDTVEVIVVANAGTAVAGAAGAAKAQGYDVVLGGTSVVGEAREVGRKLGARGAAVLGDAIRAGRPTCYLAAGETTVTVTGQGKGGRNQEVALGAALALEELLSGGEGSGFRGAGGGRGDEQRDGLRREPVGRGSLLVASVGTDGVDGPTDVAGAWADGRTVQRARERGVSPEEALAENDSYAFFEAVDGHIRTGPTGTNVMDLHVVLARPPT